MTTAPFDGGDPQERGTHEFKIEISDDTFDFHPFVFEDPIVDGAQIAGKVGAHPVTQFRILQLLKSGEIESLRATESTDLREPGSERFFVIRGDSTYDFTIDGLELEWPITPVPGVILRKLAGAREDQDLVWVKPEGFEPIGDDHQIPLDGPGVEEFRLVERHKTVTVYYRENPFTLDAREWSTEALMKEFGVPAGHKLDLIKEDGEFVELKPGGMIKLCDGMEFTSHVPVGQSS